MRSPRSDLVAAASLLLLALPAVADAAGAQGVGPAPKPPGLQPASPAAGVFDSANLLIFSVQLEALTLTEGLASYGATDDPLIPVGELTRLLEADVDVSLAQGRITGRLGEARRSLLVDLASHTARVGAQTIQLAEGDVVAGPGDIYIKLSVLQTLLPMKAKVDANGLSIQLKALERFPVQERMAREARRPETGGPVVQEKPLFVATPYALFSAPGADVTVQTGAQSTEPRFPRQYTVRVAGDLLYSDFQGYLASDESGALTSARGLLQRRSIEGGLLGPLHARELDVGDVFTPGLQLGPASSGGRGFTFSTAPFDQSNVFNRVDLRGELPPGYEVELYVNDVLKGSTNQSNNGLYEFLGVPLSPGLNVMRVVTYGPRGERNESVRVINVGAGLLHRGEATFQFGAVQQNDTLFHIGQPVLPQDAQSTQTVVGQPRVVGQINYGLTELMTLSAGAALMPQGSGKGGYGVYDLGLRTSILGVATEVDGAADSKGGGALAVGFAGAYKGVSTVLRHAEYRDGFVDENAIGAASAALERRTELTADANLKLRGEIIPISLRVLHDGYADGTDDLSASARLSASAGAILYSTGFDYTRQARSAATLTGYLTASTFRSYAWQLRATFDYQLIPTFTPQLLTVTLDHPISPTWSLHFSVGEPLDKLNGVSVSLSAVNQTRFGDLSLIGQYDNQLHAWSLQSQWNFGLGYNPIRRSYQLERSGPGSQGSLLLDAFLDENGDGIREPGEPAVSKIALETGAKTLPMTGADGALLAPGMGAGPTGNARLSLEAIDNPSVSGPPTTIQFSPRPGSITRVPYPLEPTGDVGVRVELVRDDGRTVGLSATRVRLVPAKGGAAVEGVTEYDGSVVFNQLRAGTYAVQLEPEQAKRLRMHMLDSVSVTIKSDGSFTNDAVVKVKFDAALETPQPQTASGSDGRSGEPATNSQGAS